MRRLACCALLGVTALAVGRAAPGPAAATRPALRVCADPDNLPFSNARGQGFENRLAELLARDLGAHVEYTWWAQRRGFLRETLKAGRCDVVIGLPAAIEAVWPTSAYYQSGYVFVDRRDRRRTIHSLDDPRLRRLRIAVPLVSDDGANAPPAHALARRGLAANLVRFSVLGDGGPPNPGARLVTAVADGTVDIGVGWGPIAGYFAAHQPVPLTVTPVAPRVDARGIPLVFDIGMATRRGDTARHAAIEAFLVRRRGDIDRVLAAFHVPRTDAPRPAGEGGS
jgi:mxaJ protein